MADRFEAATSVDGEIWRATDPFYPAVPQEPPVVLRQSNRAIVAYEIYVLDYGARQRSNMLLAGLGIVLVVVAGAYLSGLWLVVVAILGGVGILAGLGSLWITAEAHDQYRNELAVSVSETYEQPHAAPPPATVRPFVAATEEGGRATRAGRFDFTPAVWQALFSRALQNGGVLTRDTVVKPSGVGREHYHEGYERFIGELTRLGFVDERKRLTAAALAWYAEVIPLPLPPFASRTRSERTNGERTANERPEYASGAGEWGES